MRAENCKKKGMVLFMKRIQEIRKITNKPYLNLYEAKAVGKDGEIFPYYFATRKKEEEIKAKTFSKAPDGVAVYSVYGEEMDRLVLVKQFRYPINSYIYELPAGLVDPGETDKEAGIREMREETGLDLTVYEGGNPDIRSAFYTTVGMSDESVSLIFGYAEGKPSKQYMEETEDIQVILADKEEVKRILHEERVAMKCALLMLQFLQGEKGNPFGFLDI